MTIRHITVAAIGGALLMGIMLPMANSQVQAPPCFTFDGQIKTMQCPVSFRPAPVAYYSGVQQGDYVQATDGNNDGIDDDLPSGFFDQQVVNTLRAQNQSTFTQGEAQAQAQAQQELAEAEMRREALAQGQAEENQNQTEVPVQPQPQPAPIAEPEPEPQAAPTPAPIVEPQPERQQEPIIKVPLNRTQQELITIEELAGLNKTTHEKLTITIVEGNKTTHRETTTTEVPL